MIEQQQSETATESGEESGEGLPTKDGFAGVSRSAVGIAELFGGVLVALGASVVGVVVLSIIDPSVTDANADDQSDGAALGLQAFAVLGFVLAPFAMTMLANRGGLADAARRLGLSRVPRRLLSTIAIAIPVYLLIAGLIAGLLEPNQDDIAESLGADENASLGIKIAAGVLIIGGAAIGEELFFRGLIFGGLRQRLSLWPAALISAVLFGLPHLPQGDLAVVLQLSVLGVILAWAYERSGALWAPIALHGLNNTLAFLVLIDVINLGGL